MVFLFISIFAGEEEPILIRSSGRSRDEQVGWGDPGRYNPKFFWVYMSVCTGLWSQRVLAPAV